MNDSEYFPNNVGNYWKYKYVDSLSNVSSFVDVNIIGETILPNGQNAKIWTYTYTDHVDTSFVYQVGDTVKFLNQNFNIFNTYVIPLQLNNKWQNWSLDIDSIQVMQQDTFILNNQTFDNSFLLEENGVGPNWGRWTSEWFSPNIGMLTKIKKEFLFGLIDNSYWELVEYHLK